MITTLDQILPQAASKFPARIAYRCEGESVSYALAEKMCNQLAKALITIGISKGSRVGICLHRCIESFIAVHAVLRVGAVFVPIDVKFPAKRIYTIANDCDLQVIISSDKQASLLNDLLALSSAITIIGCTAYEKRHSWHNIFQSTVTDVISEGNNATDMAYIMYSSGSTGTPKGIVHTHLSGMAYAKASAELYQLNEHDVVVSHSILSYDISTFAYFTSPLVGACTLVLSDLICMVPASLSALLENERATVWYSVPLALKQLLKLGALESRNLNALRWVLYGGEPIPVDDIRRLMSLLPHAMFSNVYGPAEVNQCTFYNFNAIDSSAREVPLGEVWSAAKYLLIDDENNVLTDEVQTGELVVHSATMMSGYWNSQKPVSEIFYTSGVDSDSKYYRTGDIIHKASDGKLYFVGRKDRQVKIHGYRVELKEIEHLLLQLSGLKEVAVLADKKSRENDYIAVFAVKANGHEEISIQSIQSYLKQLLPAYALPEVIVFLDDMPYAASGKKDITRLEQLLIEINERESTNIHTRSALV